MSANEFLDYWLFFPHVWIILGLIFLTLEVTDGSAIFFLPMGIASIIQGIWIALLKADILPSGLLPTSWYWLVCLWVVITVAISVALSLKFKRKFLKGSDINKY